MAGQWWPNEGEHSFSVWMRLIDGRFPKTGRPAPRQRGRCKASAPFSRYRHQRGSGRNAGACETVWPLLVLRGRARPNRAGEPESDIRERWRCLLRRT